MNIDGYPVILADTAGIRDAKNEVEKKGISLALGKSKEADLNIVVIDNSSKSINNEIKKMINKDTIVLLNKSDKTKRNYNLLTLSKVKTYFQEVNKDYDPNIIIFSAKFGVGLSDLAPLLIRWLNID